MLGPDTNPLAPLLQHQSSPLLKAQAAQPWHLTGERHTTMVPHGGNVQEIAQGMEEQEVIL